MVREDCVFCQILAGNLPGDVLYEDDQLAVLKDINPQAPTHLLLVPKKHIPQFTDFDDEDTKLICRIMTIARDTAKDMNMNEKGFRLIMNEGKDAGQSIFHLHWHLLSGRRLMWPPG